MSYDETIMEDKLAEFELQPPPSIIHVPNPPATRRKNWDHIAQARLEPSLLDQIINAKSLAELSELTLKVDNAKRMSNKTKRRCIDEVEYRTGQFAE